MAWNEPGGEKRNPWNRPQQSQNDLDDVLRNFQRRLSALFGRGSGGGGGGTRSTSFGKGLSSIVILIGAVWIGSGLYRVDAQERAVVLRFGKYLQTTGPGYNWHLPWPIERKIIVNVSHQYSVVDDASMLTSDTNLVEVKSAVQFNRLSVGSRNVKVFRLPCAARNNCSICSHSASVRPAYCNCQLTDAAPVSCAPISLPSANTFATVRYAVFLATGNWAIDPVLSCG